MPRVEGPQTDGVQAVVLALRILEFLADAQGEVGVTTLADALGTTKSRIHRHLQTLVGQGYVARSVDSDRYRIGPNLVALGLSVGDQLDLAAAALPVLRELRAATGIATVVSQLEEDGMRVLRAFRGTSQIEIGVRPGSLLPFHASAQGKVALAFGPEDLRLRVLRSRLPLLTPETVVTPSALSKELEKIRAQGWAVAPNQTAIGVNTLAAPIMDAAGAVIGAMGMVDSIQHIDVQPHAEQIELLRDAARRVSREFGFSGP